MFHVSEYCETNICHVPWIDTLFPEPGKCQSKNKINTLPNPITFSRLQITLPPSQLAPKEQNSPCFFCGSPSLCLLQNKKKALFLNCKWHYHYHGIEVPLSFSWYYREAALTLFLSKTSASLLSGLCFYLGALLFFLPLGTMGPPPSWPSPVFGGVCHGDHTGSLPPGMWNNLSVPSLAWQWELVFLGAQIPRSPSHLLRVDNIYMRKALITPIPYLFICILCCFDLQPPLKVLVW